MNSSSSISSSNFIESDFFVNNEEITEYVELPTKSSFNRLYKIKRFGQWFILKALKPEFASQALYVSLLKKEFEVAVQLDHPYIVKTILKENNKRVGPAIMMEYIDGMTLDEYIKTNPSKSERLRVINQILDAMKYFHSKQIIHRDLKPSNILITHNGFNVKIIDFGLADVDSYAIFKLPAGTKKYAAPEQMIPGHSIDARSDIYSFGKLLKTILPFGYKWIINHCIAESPDSRYNNVSEIIRAFKIRKNTLFAFIVTVLFGIMLLPSIIFLSNKDDYMVYVKTDEQIIAQSLSKIDSIYKPIINRINKGDFKYREFAQMEVLLTYDTIKVIREKYEDMLSDTTIMYSQFQNAYQIRWGKFLQQINEEYFPKIPSFYTEFSDGRISAQEFNRLEDEYKKLFEKVIK